MTTAREWLERYATVRSATMRLAAPLGTEDAAVQSMPDASPTKWHLAHTTWFFETFVVAGDRPFHPQFGYLFNSYYEAVGPRHPRIARGLLTRPTLAEVRSYRAHVDDRVAELVRRGDADLDALEIGLHHEQQHQELLLTDVKHLFAQNPLRPAYAEPAPPDAREDHAPRPLGWVQIDEGIRAIGDEGRGFAYDNERPRHRVFVGAFEIADRLVTSGEYLEFIEDGGYARPELWLDEGWAAVKREGWAAPLYWQREATGDWTSFTLRGPRALGLAAPVCHVSFFEADAFARWSRARLATEAEWETACAPLAIEGNFAEDGRLHPHAVAMDSAPAIRQAFGDTWEWTRSAYDPYPGYAPAEGALGEYNGKFMCSQFVLRGGSCVTPRSHVRATYRNFFRPDARWQFTGIRLAR